MEGHYFDIETYSPNDIPDPKTDKIISIQFQKIDLSTGEPVGRLQILKEWEMGEKDMLKLIYQWFFKRNRWKFIPVGFNLVFEWKFLSEKFKQYDIDEIDLGSFIDEFPQIDLKVFAVMKTGSFQGASLSSISNKNEDGEVIKQFYEIKDYISIEKYIRNEAESFIDLFKQIKNSNFFKNQN